MPHLTICPQDETAVNAAADTEKKKSTLCDAADEARPAGAEKKVTMKRRNSPPPDDGVLENPLKKPPSYRLFHKMCPPSQQPASDETLLAAHHHQGGKVMHEANATTAQISPWTCGGIGGFQLNAPWMKISDPYQAYLMMMSSMAQERSQRVVPTISSAPSSQTSTEPSSAPSSRPSSNELGNSRGNETQRNGLPFEESGKITANTQQKQSPSTANNVLENWKTITQRFDYFVDGKGYIIHINIFDVISGRGTGPNDHPGNMNFRIVIERRKAEYLALKPRDIKRKNFIAKQIIGEVLSKGGRFLRKVKDDESTGASMYEFVEENVAMEKVKQALRQKRVEFENNVNRMNNWTNDFESLSCKPQEDGFGSDANGRVQLTRGEGSYPSVHNMAQSASAVKSLPPKSQFVHQLIVPPPSALAVASRSPTDSESSRLTTPEEQEARDALLQLLKWKESKESVQK